MDNKASNAPKDRLVVTKIKTPKPKPRSERIESVVRIGNSFHYLISAAQHPEANFSPPRAAAGKN